MSKTLCDLINLTPHPITFVGKDGNETVLKPGGVVARLKEETVVIDTASMKNDEGVEFEIPVLKHRYTIIENLPPIEEKVFYIVSNLVRLHSNRTDLLSPGDLVRDDEGKIKGAGALYF